MANQMFKSAREAAAKVAPLGLAWLFYYGDPGDREMLQRFAAALDEENPLADHDDCFYVACDDGSFGITTDGGKIVFPLAKLELEAPIEERAPIAETPWMVVWGEIKDMWRGTRKLFTLKGVMNKLLITAAIMLVVWIGTSVWQLIAARHGNAAPFVVDLFAYLSFANGGVSTNPLYIVGGLLGKTFIMGTVFAFVLGGFMKCFKGFGPFFRCFARLDDNKAASRFVMGIAVACILYNFFVGEATLALSMAGVAGALSMLWCLGGGVNFIRSMTVAVTAHVNRDSRVHYVDWPHAVDVLSGMFLGFLIAIAFTMLGAFAPYILGAVLLVIAIVMRFVKTGNRQKNALAAILLIAMLSLPAVADAKSWRLEYEKVDIEEYVNPLTPDDANVYTIASLAPDKHKITNEIFHRDLSFSCSQPPSAITPESSFRLKVQKSDPEEYKYSKSMMNAFWALSFKPAGAPQPAPFSTLSGYSWTFADNNKDKNNWAEHDEILSFSDGMLRYAGIVNGDLHTYDLPDGSKVCLEFHSPRAITTWTYNYRIVDDEPEEAIVPPIDEPEETVEPEEPIDEEELLKLLIAIFVSSGGAGIALILSLIEKLGKESGDGSDGSRPSDDYVKPNPDGTVTYINPITGEEDIRPGEEEEALREQVETVLRNIDYYKDSQQKHEKWKEQTHEELQKHIAQRNKECDEKRKLQKRLAEMEKKREEMIIDLRYKYNVMDDDPDEKKLREAMAKETEKALEQYARSMKISEYSEKFYKYTKVAKDLTDATMDVFAVCAGPTGAKVRDGYRMMAEFYGAVSEGVIKKKSFKEVLGVGLTRGTITVLQYNTDGAPKAVVTIVGEGCRDFANALFDGKSPAEAARAFGNGVKRGIENAIIDKLTSFFGDHFKSKVTNPSKVVPSDEIKEKVVDSIVNVTDDLGKVVADDYISS